MFDSAPFLIETGFKLLGIVLLSALFMTARAMWPR